MTGTDLIPLPMFEGREIRAIEQSGEVWIPLVDLAAAWGIDRTTPYNILMRNLKLFAGLCNLEGDVTSHTGATVNERGLYLLMGRINTDRLKNPDAAEVILRFQRWVPELIQRFRKGEIQQIQAAPKIDEELKRAQYLTDLTGGNLQAFQKIALEKCGFKDYAPALNVVKVLHGETGWYSPTRLIPFCNDPDLTPERLNWYLKNKGFQYKDGYLWRLTPQGWNYGEEYQFNAPGGHSEPRIAWRKNILIASCLIKEKTG